MINPDTISDIADSLSYINDRLANQNADTASIAASLKRIMELMEAKERGPYRGD